MLDISSTLAIFSIMSTNNEKLGDYLKSLRLDKELTLRDVERLAGISNAYLSQIEGGKVRSPSPTVLHKLSTIYETSYSMIMKWAGYPIPGADTEGNIRQSFAQQIGPLTKNEEKALLEYLDFLRSKRRR